MKKLKILSLVLVICILIGCTPFSPSVVEEDYHAPLLHRSVELANLFAGEETTTRTAHAISTEDDFSPNEILVVLKHRNSRVNAPVRTSWFAGMGVQEVRDLSVMQNIDDGVWGMTIEEYEILYAFRQILLLTLDQDCQQNVINVISQLEELEFVYSAAPNYIMELPSTFTSSNLPNTQDFTGNPLLEYPWGLQNIRAQEAWYHFGVGSSNVNVAVIDSGIDASHGAFYINNENNIVCRDSRDFLVSRNRPREDNIGHGTHVAGIIGAVRENDRGNRGIARNVTLVSYRITSTGVFAAHWLDSTLIEAINYAHDNRIPIINISLGFPNPRAVSSNFILPAFPGLAVLAAGNDGADIDNDSRFFLPNDINLPNMITVANITYNSSGDIVLCGHQFGEHSHCIPGATGCTPSSFGAISVHIAAPGCNVYSTFRSGYDHVSGTSMAAPHVAGVAALLMGNFPDASPAQVRRAILNSAVRTTSLVGRVSTNGRLDALEAHDYMYYNIINNPVGIWAAMSEFEFLSPADYRHIAYDKALRFATDLYATASAIRTAAERLDAFNAEALPDIIAMRNFFAYFENELNEQDYTSESWVALTTVVDNAIIVYNNPRAKISAINHAWNALYDAHGALIAV